VLLSAADYELGLRMMDGPAHAQDSYPTPTLTGEARVIAARLPLPGLRQSNGRSELSSDDDGRPCGRSAGDVRADADARMEAAVSHAP
jgi:hypothetical protein